MADINILMNNFEDVSKQVKPLNKGTMNPSKLNPKKTSMNIDIKSIACDFGFANLVAIPDDGCHSIASNE
jgi:hypothetical protein